MDMPKRPVRGEADEQDAKREHEHGKDAAAKREAVLRGELMANRKTKPPAKAVVGAAAALVVCVIVIVVAVLVVKGAGA